MSQQTEEKKQIGGQTNPPNAAGRKQNPFRRWLGVAIAVVVVAVLLVTGILSRVRARYPGAAFRAAATAISTSATEARRSSEVTCPVRAAAGVLCALAGGGEA